MDQRDAGLIGQLRERIGGLELGLVGGDRARGRESHSSRLTPNLTQRILMPNSRKASYLLCRPDATLRCHEPGVAWCHGPRTPAELLETS
jgi:hypothetical protein